MFGGIQTMSTYQFFGHAIIFVMSNIWMSAFLATSVHDMAIFYEPRHPIQWKITAIANVVKKIRHSSVTSGQICVWPP